VILPYAALRGVGASRPRALLATAFALSSPWSVWLGAATVPESFTASAVAAAAIGLGAPSTSSPARIGLMPSRARIGLTAPRARIGLALALLAACLSRYEAWPVAAVLAVAVGLRARRERSTVEGFAAALLAFGPLAWMTWNLYAHEDALHFFVRVSRFKRALGEGASDPIAALLLYPRLLVTMRPDVVVAAAAAALSARRFLDPRVLRRWRLPLACAAAQLAFLAYGNLRDGAPAHHAERALLGVTFLLAAFAADVLVAAHEAGMPRGRAVAGLLAAAWIATSWHALTDVPGRGPGEDRASQIARGRAIRDENGGAFTVTPCAYEHFALIAAYGAPEDVTVEPTRKVAPTPACPAIARR